MRKILLVLIIPVVFLLLRIINPSQVDDVNPECENYLVEQNDILWITPFLNNVTLSEKWCKYILSLNKTLGLHGIYHTYDEFNIDRNQEYLDKGINEFFKCFGYKPRIFKAPQLKISEQNKKLIEKNNMTLYSTKEQILSKVYHCNNSGRFSNNFIRAF